MGYSTDFVGRFALSRPLSSDESAYLSAFAGTRRVHRDASIMEKVSDIKREKVGLPVGDNGQYCVSDSELGIINNNKPPHGQPGLWCDWIPNKDDSAIVWSESEKFYSYIEWLSYIISHFLIPWGHVLNGTVDWQGEDLRDFGRIVVVNNIVSVSSY